MCLFVCLLGGVFLCLFVCLFVLFLFLFLFYLFCLLLDVENPLIAGIPDSIIQGTDDNVFHANVSWVQPTATDNSGVVTLVSSHNPGDLFLLGETTVNYTATDPSGNVHTELFVINIKGTHTLMHIRRK